MNPPNPRQTIKAVEKVKYIERHTLSFFIKFPTIRVIALLTVGCRFHSILGKCDPDYYKDYYRKRYKAHGAHWSCRPSVPATAQSPPALLNGVHQGKQTQSDSELDSWS